MSKSPIKRSESPTKKVLDNTDVISRLTSELVSNPDILAAYGRKLDSMVQQESGFIQYLPRCVKRRLKALKKMQKESFEIEEEFYLRVHHLEAQYAIMQAPIMKRRKEITTAFSEPSEEECEFSSDDDDEEVAKRIAMTNKTVGDNEKVTNKTEMDKSVSTTFTEKTKGIPDFWLTIFRNVSLLHDLVQKQDMPVLSKLRDIRSEYFKNDSDIGFELIFDFGDNEYFEDKELRKRYSLRLGPDPKDPMSYEGPEIVASMEFPIKWKKDKNVTVKTKRIKRGTKRYVNKTVKMESFFNFFSPPKCKNADECQDAELIGDFEVGQVLKDNIIPRALLYYTGMAFKDDEDDEDEEYYYGSSDDDYDRRKERGKEEKKNATKHNAAENDTTDDASSED